MIGIVKTFEVSAAATSGTPPFSYAWTVQSKPSGATAALTYPPLNPYGFSKLLEANVTVPTGNQNVILNWDPYAAWYFQTANVEPPDDFRVQLGYDQNEHTFDVQIFGNEDDIALVQLVSGPVDGLLSISPPDEIELGYSVNKISNLYTQPKAFLTCDVDGVYLLRVTATDSTGATQTQDVPVNTGDVSSSAINRSIVRGGVGVMGI